MINRILAIYVIMLMVLPTFTKFGPFATNDPNPQFRKHVEHPKKISSLWGENIKRPYPTNAWWENLAMNAGEQTVNTYPYIFKAKTDQLCFTMPTFIENKAYILSNYIDEWCMRLPEAHGHKVTRFDEMSVTIEYPLPAPRSISVPFFLGSPYAVTEVKSMKLELLTINALLEVKDGNGKIYKPELGPTTDPSDKFTLLMNNNHRWVIYFDTKVQLQLGVSRVSTVEIYSGAIKFAVINDENMEALLDKYRYAQPTSVEVDYSVTGITARIYYKYKIKGTGELLMLALPHHMDALMKPSVVEGIKYRTIRGNAVGVVGTTWTFQEFLPRYVWDSLTPVDPSKIPTIKTALEKDYKFEPGAKDPYFFGVEIGKLAKLALICDQIGEIEKAAYIRTTMEKHLGNWLDGTNVDPLLYDTTYGGIVSTNGIKSEQEDFGNGFYNDHHFHYGYHVMAAAVIGRKNPDFLVKYKEQILTYVRDYANPSSQDTYFTPLRNKDWWGWHSWASGLFEFADGRNQESTSEALMAYYAIMLLGDAMGNNQMFDFGRLLLAMETRAAKKYWHMPSKSDVYPEIFKANRMVGIVWANKVDYATWFGGNPIFIHGIQMLPFLPPTDYSLDKEFMQEEYEIIKNENSPEDWVGYRICARAIIDKNAAWAEAQSVESYHSGTCKSIVLHWIATRP